MEFGDAIWWKITLKIHNRADVFSFVRSYEKLHSKIPLISITLLIKQISPGVWTVFGCFHLGARSYIVIGRYRKSYHWPEPCLRFKVVRYSLQVLLSPFWWFFLLVLVCKRIILEVHMWLYWFTDTIHNHSRGADHMKKCFFSTSRDSKTTYSTTALSPVWHDEVGLFTQWSCGFLPIATLTDLHTWQVMAAPQSPPHWSISQSFVDATEGCGTLASVQFFISWENWAKIHLI